MINEGILQDILKCAEEHRQAYEDEVQRLIRTYDRQYKDLVGDVLDGCIGSLGDHGDITGPYLLQVRRLLANKSWFAWYLYSFSPVLDLTPDHTFFYTFLAYNALHLHDDSLDGHEYSDHANCQTLYGLMVDQGRNVRESSAVSAMVGMLLINECLKALNKSEVVEPAMNLVRLTRITFGGMLAEFTYLDDLGLEEYWTIIKRKAVSYQMILEHVFFSDLEQSFRSKLLSTNASILNVSQLADDLDDWKNDVDNRNFGVSHIRGFSREKLMKKIDENISIAWTNCLAFDKKVKNALAFRIRPIIGIIQNHR